MRLLLIRHGETVDNVAGNYAGITDSALTNHGVLQANRLGSHLSATGVKIGHIFSSDLQRAVKTAEAICDVQSPAPLHIKLQHLREQDFGFYEGKKFFERPREGGQSGKDAHMEAHRNGPGFVDVESKESMRIRVETFIDTHLVQLLHDVEEEMSVVVVAHGIILSHLWRAILKRFHPWVAAAPGVVDTRGLGFEYLGGWSNTGYLELEVKRRAGSSDFTSESSSGGITPKPSSPSMSTAPEPALPDGSASEKSTSKEPVTSSSTTLNKQATPTARLDDSFIVPAPPRGLNGLSLVIKAVNSQEHLKNLKKTRGGIGSLKHDSSQKTVDSFFKKRKFEPEPPS